MPPKEDDSPQEAMRRIERAKHSNTTSLNLIRLNLTTIPESVAQLVNLRKLDMRINKITIIPDWLAQLSDLEELNVYGNHITAIPDSLERLTKPPFRV